MVIFRPFLNKPDLGMMEYSDRTSIAEQAVLGSILVEPSMIIDIGEVLQPNDFASVFLSKCYSVCLNLFNTGRPIDELTIAQLLERDYSEQFKGLDFKLELTEILLNTPTSRNAIEYANIVREASQRRSAIIVAKDLEQDVLDTKQELGDVLDTATSRIMSLQESGRVESTMTPVVEVLPGVLEAMELASARLDGTGLLGLPSGFPDLDELTSGFCPGDYILLAGRPSMGKTTLAMNILEEQALSVDDIVVFFSLEMPKNQVMFKLISSISGVDFEKIRKGRLEDKEWALVGAAVKRIKDDMSNLYIDDASDINPMEMRRKIRKIQMTTGKKVASVCVDYLQLMSAVEKHELRSGEISEISGSLKRLAKDLGCPVIALSQLNRGLESRADKRPVNSDLRESGALEQDADIIMFVYRDEVYNPDTPDKGTAEIIIGKQRNGPLGRVRVQAALGQSRFISM